MPRVDSLDFHLPLQMEMSNKIVSHLALESMRLYIKYERLVYGSYRLSSGTSMKQNWMILKHWFSTIQSNIHIIEGHVEQDSLPYKTSNGFRVYP